MNLKIPFFSFDSAPESLKNEWISAAAEVIKNGNYILGSAIKDFESNWSEYLGTEGSVSIGNGFDGLCIALMSLGIKAGDRVAVPAHTFIACWFAIHKVGGIPVGVDVDEDGLMDLDEIANLREIPEFVMPVHMHGKMINMNRLMTWARANGVRVVEDCSQSHGASLDGKLAGTWGDVGVFSLYPTKNLGALGDAGVLVSNNLEVLQKARQFRNYGATSESKYRHEMFGMNSRLDEIQAAFLLVNLKYLGVWTKRRREIGELYEKEIIPTLRINVLQGSGLDNVRHHFVVTTNVRELLISELTKGGISTDIHYPYLAAHEYQDICKVKRQPFPRAEKLITEIISLPISQWQTDSEVKHVSNTLNEILNKLN